MKLKNLLLPIVFAQALIGTVGSLFVSDVQNLTPCNLCWYQRIALYPIMLIAAIAYLREDKKAHHYVLPFSIVGLLFSSYHNLLYYDLLPKNLQTCSFSGASCTAHYINWLWVFDIPQLSLIAFAVITICMILFAKKSKTPSKPTA
ncbi:MAG: disulfide bond formation protein B [Patescibacteria group bacterium]|nr:disulfide bond formation protein B [Patescibacteria group bacterium]MBU2509117.1 disulfide bond formation protein B [Patescibacteria group bacterium]